MAIYVFLNIPEYLGSKKINPNIKKFIVGIAVFSNVRLLYRNWNCNFSHNAKKIENLGLA